MNIWPRKKKTSALVYVPVALAAIGIVGVGASMMRAAAKKRSEKKQEDKDLGRWESEGGNPAATSVPSAKANSSTKLSADRAAL